MIAGAVQVTHGGHPMLPSFFGFHHFPFIVLLTKLRIVHKDQLGVMGTDAVGSVVIAQGCLVGANRAFKNVSF